MFYLLTDGYRNTIIQAMKPHIYFNIRLNAVNAKEFKKELNVLDPNIGDTPDTMAEGEDCMEINWTMFVEYYKGLAMQLEALKKLVKLSAEMSAQGKGHDLFVSVDYAQLKEGEMMVYRVLKELHEMRLQKEVEYAEYMKTTGIRGIDAYEQGIGEANDV